MTYNVFEEYKKAVKSKYELEKKGVYSSFLLQPSRANLRNLCTERFKGNISIEDLATYRLFFGFDFEECNRNKLNNETGRFRSIENFFKETTDTNDIETINLAAILVDFNPRPFRKFSKVGPLVETDDYKSDITNKDVEKDSVNHPGSLKQNGLINPNESISKDNSKMEKNRKPTLGKVVAILLGSLIITMSGFGVKEKFFKDPECMLWQNDHYIVVDCKSNLLEIVNVKKPYNEIEFNRKKLKVCDTFTFFKNNEPVVWYSKKDNIVEFFNMDGKNPENGCELKQVSQHMIDKYVPPCK